MMMFGKRFTVHNHRHAPIYERTCERCFGTDHILKSAAIGSSAGTGANNVVERVCHDFWQQVSAAGLK
jgi:hypothetical protein